MIFPKNVDVAAYTQRLSRKEPLDHQSSQTAHKRIDKIRKWDFVLHDNGRLNSSITVRLAMRSPDKSPTHRNLVEHTNVNRAFAPSPILGYYYSNG